MRAFFQTVLGISFHLIPFGTLKILLAFKDNGKTFIDK